MPEAPHTPDPVREEVFHGALGVLHGAPRGAQPLLRPLFEGIPTAELAARSPEALAAAAASLAGLAAQRAPGEIRLRLFPPGGGRGPHAVVEIVNDDMPFLVDSVLASLNRSGRVVREFLHPILAVTRDGAGALHALGEGEARESLMRVTIAGTPAHMLPGTEPGDWAEVEAALRRTLADTQLAVRDFPAMLSLLDQAAEEVRGHGEAAEFLGWLRDENFVLLGHRRLMLDADGARMVAEENLGLLRDMTLPVFDALRGLPELPEAIRTSLLGVQAVRVAKANMRSTVHRPQHADVVATRIQDASGRVLGVRLFVGLFAAAAYNRNPRSIPLLRGKVERILDASGIRPDSHDGRALRNALDTWPRDELFQASEEAVLEGARIALDLAIRPRPALFTRRDPFGRFVSIIAWLPREGFDTKQREKVGGILARAHGGRLSAFHIALGDSPLARIHYIVGTDPAHAVMPDHAALEAAIAQAVRAFPDRLAEALSEELGEARATTLLGRWGDAFPASYRDGVTAAQALADLHLAEAALAAQRPRAELHHLPGEGPRRLTLRLASPGHALALADVLPLFESLDLRAIEEQPYRLAPRGVEGLVLHIFQLEAGADCPEERFAPLLDALSALLEGHAETDGFNRLVLRAGLSWRECWVLRAMFRWLKQVGFAFSQGSVETALVANPQAARLLLEIFAARFDPEAAARDEAALETRWDALLDAVADPDCDRILARLRHMLDGMLRTNFYQGKAYLAFKLDSAAAGDMPQPRPWREIFVHSPSMEGCHLRAGPVARGGIRWSDRREDFRSEVLDLMKAQRLKNVVIVPTGAKGGFVLKGTVPSQREAFMATGIAAYSTLIRGMLDVTDNLHGTEVVPPPSVVRRDGDDPYIVAAADKGTATFSDIANGLSAEYGFWLGDAFASGGSAGYDHKGMGITARGAWVMVERHFQEALGRSIHDAPFTCAGVGDMSGDVFGNGLLVSRQTKLVAAFDHRHIFLDPDPDPARSFEERERLFRLPRSSWADYDTALISTGGGVFPRGARSIPLSLQAQRLLGLKMDRAEPALVMQAILRMEVDLLYFGGIGTYVKAGTETQAQAGDRANDALRVDGRELRARVLGEGANLGITQAGRIEAAHAGVRLNTDALDNSAGVSTSDHEVNIKILLAAAEAEGGLTRRSRDALLAEMTDEVAAMVLRDNALQSVAVSLEALSGAAGLPGQATLMARLEAEGLLDRQQAVLPGAEAMAAREAEGAALTRPEIAALLPVAKLWLTDALAESTLPDAPVFAPLLEAYFPTPLRVPPFAEFLAGHKLRRDLTATALANQVANRLGCAALGRLTAEADPVSVVGAAWLASELYGLEERFEEAEAAEPGPRLDAQRVLRDLLEAATVELLEGGDIAERLAALREGVGALIAAETALPDDAHCRTDLPAGLAAFVAAAPRLASAPSIVALAARAGVTPGEAAQAWAEAGHRFAFEPLREALRRLRIGGPFGDRARAALLADLRATQSRLAAAILAGQKVEGPQAVALAREAARQADLASATVAARALAALA
ncbi:NAD-glutamate dehydrogenase [Roseococcus suduntuyensis]|uniref:Glutamate dehydrogenase n=1 Tax=Roseococcus suduntuyensis TaxID=455361 RepID=A0A840A9D0_9PROT|nr:NAD-glutamate dehydrogenase domain-containing protein [Roseococcus suduntuyensis]MBB3897126.1 glutamate dehydrogenase [Roseococcus suduntuyensis]